MQGETPVDGEKEESQGDQAELQNVNFLHMCTRRPSCESNLYPAFKIREIRDILRLCDQAGCRHNDHPPLQQDLIRQLCRPFLRLKSDGGSPVR